MGDAVSFDLSSVFHTVAEAIPDHEAVVWRDRRYPYAQLANRIEGVANHLVAAGLGCHTERDLLAGHESGQDHIGLYLRNGNEYLETMIAAYRARVAPFNVSYRYVEEELIYLLNDSRATALAYNAEFAPRVAAIRDRVPTLRVLIQVADGTEHALLPGAVDYESIVTTTTPDGGLPEPTGDDLYVLYTGGTTGMPKGVLWRQHDIFISAMGGKPFGSDTPMTSYAEIAERATAAAGAMSILMLPPLMHGAAQWAAYNVITMGGRMVFPDDVERMRADEVLALVDREKVLSIPVVGDAMARPLIDEIETGKYELSSLISITNGGAPMSPAVRDRIRAAMPNALLIDAVGSSEAGQQMNTVATGDADAVAVFSPQGDTAVVATDFSRILQPGDGDGWLARRNIIPLGYLGDAVKTAKTFLTIDGVRWSVPGDKARYLADGRIELLGRDSVTINSGGEKIFAEEVERAVAAHPNIYDVVVVGRPSERWGSEVVAIVQFAEGKTASDDELAQVCNDRIARYKVPKAFIHTPKVLRSPAGKADYRWAKEVAMRSLDNPVSDRAESATR